MKIVIGTVRELGLQVAPHKTEAIFVYDRRRGPLPPATIQVRTTMVQVRLQVRLQMKYLDLTIDGLWLTSSG